MRTGSRWGRVARGWSAAAFATTAAAVSHTIAGGQAPGVFGVTASLVLSGFIATIAVGRRPSVLRLGIAMAASQVLFHGLFSTLGAPVLVDHTHTAMTMGADATAPHHAGAMWLAHAAAGLAAFVVYRYGEAAYLGLATTAALVLARLRRALLAEPLTLSPAAAPEFDIRVPALRSRLGFSLSRRGPPLGIAGA